MGGDGADLAWYNYFTPDTSRGSAFAHLTFDLNDNASVFLQGLYGVDETSYLSPPAGGQFATWAATIYWNNAFLPANVASRMPDRFHPSGSVARAISTTARPRRSSRRTS